MHHAGGCVYEEGAEDLLFENQVNDIREVDLSPFYLAEVQLPDYVLRLHEPLVITPDLDESKQLICLANPWLGIDVCAFTRDELDEALMVEFDVLWRNYAKADDDRLSPAATERKRGLLARMEEVARAER